ncbi:hypothetical protein EYF80_008407 [Liparis tanakae]|uniref:Uncharacterized protein n=1 Tax=Liparis tanakae TaxID=230148 RepID=A0A4Z2IU62_9TELE|nr:hypothetical protein EYF80_008407 [Liparis tanakae]
MEFVTVSPERHSGSRDWRLRCPECSGSGLHIGICNRSADLVMSSTRTVLSSTRTVLSSTRTVLSSTRSKAASLFNFSQPQPAAPRGAAGSA